MNFTARPEMSKRRSSVSTVVVLCVIFCGRPFVPADEPSVETILPLGLNPGETRQVQVIGQHVTPAARLWTSCGLTSSPAAEQPAGHFVVSVPAETPLGIHGFRVVGEEGVSRLRLFVVDDLPGVLASSENRQPEQAQHLSLPSAVDGTVEKLQRHYFQFEAEAGQQVSFEVLARRLGSPLDPALFLYREDGRELAYVDDVEGLGGDCQLTYTFSESGQFVVEVRDIRYEGGGGHFYRLRIGDFPCLNGPYPMAVRRGVSTRVDFAGLDVVEADPARVQVPDDWPHHWFAVTTRRSAGQAAAFSHVAVTNGNEFREQEPNDTPAQANRVALGDHLNARFDVPGDEDRFTFSAKKGDRYRFRGVTRQRGAATDLVLRLLDGEGKQLARKDDEGTDEGIVDHTFAEEGEYTLVAADLHRRGGPRFAYRIEVEAYTKGFSITAAAERLNVPAGGVGRLPVNVVRRGDNGTITVAAAGLPEGWTSLPTVIGPSMNAGVLTIRAPEVAPVPPRVAELQVVGTTEIGGVRMTETADLSAAVAAQLNNMRTVPLNVRTSVAAAVAPAAPFSVRFEPSEVVFGPNLKTTVKVVVDRGDTITEAITLATDPEKSALPRETTIALKPIEKGKNEVTLELSGGAKAPPGPFSVVFVATHKKDKATHTVASPPLSYRLDLPMELQVDAGDRNLPRGGEQKVTVKVIRNPAFSGDVKLLFDKLPKGVNAEPVTLPAGETVSELVLKATNEAALGKIDDILVKAIAAANDKLTASNGIGAITIQ